MNLKIFLITYLDLSIAAWTLIRSNILKQTQLLFSEYLQSILRCLTPRKTNPLPIKNGQKLTQQKGVILIKRL